MVVFPENTDKTVVLSGSYMLELGYTQTLLDPLRIITITQICNVLFLHLASCDSLLFLCVSHVVLTRKEQIAHSLLLSWSCLAVNFLTGCIHD